MTRHDTSRTRSAKKFGMSAALALMMCGPANAQEFGDWVWQVTPYVWATGVSGDITPFAGAPTASFDSSFSEVLEDLDGAFFLSGYARRGRLVFLGDLSYSRTSREGRIPPGISAEGELEQTSLTFAAGYRVVEDPAVAVDLLAGARFWRIEGAVDVPLVGVARSATETFTDPILAVRANFSLAPNWSAIVYGDYGGFGVGSEKTSQLVATVNYRVNERFLLSGGYRVLNVDYRDGGTRIDATMSGPMFGATWRF